jgi:hypothetical protein
VLTFLLFLIELELLLVPGGEPRTIFSNVTDPNRRSCLEAIAILVEINYPWSVIKMDRSSGLFYEECAIVALLRNGYGHYHGNKGGTMLSKVLANWQKMASTTLLSLPLRLAVPAAVGALSTTALDVSCNGSDAKVAESVALRRRLTPIGKTSLLTELPSNRSIPMFLLRIKCVFLTHMKLLFFQLNV